MKFENNFTNFLEFILAGIVILFLISGLLIGGSLFAAWIILLAIISQKEFWYIVAAGLGLYAVLNWV